MCRFSMLRIRIRIHIRLILRFLENLQENDPGERPAVSVSRAEGSMYSTVNLSGAQVPK